MFYVIKSYCFTSDNPHNALTLVLSFVSSQLKKYLIWFKITILLVVWCVFTAFLMSNNEHVDQLSLISVPSNGSTRGEHQLYFSIVL